MPGGPLLACYAVTLSGSQSHCCCQLHILLPVLAESALNMHVLLQFWLVVLQYANTASSLGRCCSTLPCMFAFSHGCICLNMQILLSVLLCCALYQGANNPSILAGLACTCRRCTHSYDATLADSRHAAAAVLRPCYLQESCLTSTPPSFCSC